MPSSSLSRCTSCHTLARLIGSRPVVGSSRNNTSGFVHQRGPRGRADAAYRPSRSRCAGSSASPMSTSSPQLGEATFDLVVAEPVQLTLEPEQLEPGLAGIEGDVLERDADPQPYCLRETSRLSKPATSARPPVGGEQRAEHLHGGRLARRRFGPRQAVDLAALDGEVEESRPAGDLAETYGRGPERWMAVFGRNWSCCFLVRVVGHRLHGSQPREHCGLILTAMARRSLGDQDPRRRAEFIGERRPHGAGAPAPLFAPDPPETGPARSSSPRLGGERPHVCVATSTGSARWATRFDATPGSGGGYRLATGAHLPPPAPRRRRSRRHRGRAARPRARRVDRRHGRDRAAGAGQARAGASRPAPAARARGGTANVSSLQWGRWTDGRRRRARGARARVS